MAIGEQEFKEKLAAAEAYTSLMHGQIISAEDAYNLRYTKTGLGLSNVPEDMPLHVSSTGPAIVDHFVDQVRTGSPRVDLGPVRRGSKAQERTDRLAAFGRHVLESLRIHEDEPVWDYVTFALALYGCAAVRVLFDEDYWPTEEDEQKTAWPFRIRAVHPRALYVAPGYRWPYEWVIEHQRRTVGEARYMYGAWKPEARAKDTDAVDMHFYWDKDTYAVFIGGGKVEEKDNVLGIPPFIWVFSGMGHKAFDGGPETQAVGILTHVLDELKHEIVLLTAANSAWRMNVWPTLVGTMPEKDARNKWSVGPFRYIQVDSMEEAPAFLRPAEINQQLYAVLPLVRQSIERATYSEVLTGERPAGVDYGVLYGMQIGQARLRVDAVKHSVERAAGMMVGLVARYVERVTQKPMTVEGKAVDAGDIDGFTDFRVKFDAIDPAENDRKIQTGLALRVRNEISWRTFLTDFLRVEDADEEMLQVWTEQAINQLIQSGYLTQPILASVQTQEGMESVQTEAKRVQSELERRGAPAGKRLGTMTPGGEGPLNTPRLGAP